MPSENLKPCPFCGGTAEMLCGSPGCHWVRCQSCNAASDDRSAESAALIWNKRTAAEQAEPLPTGYYYPIPMPLDADGKGPASFEEGEVRKLVFEVWDQDFHSHGTFDNLPEAIAEANRLNAPAARSGAVKVKQLQWVEPEAIGYNIRLVATDLFGRECARLCLTAPTDKQIDEAKAAAQADYERRIFAALEPAEPATDAEPVGYLIEHPTDQADRNLQFSEISKADRADGYISSPLFKARPHESRLREADALSQLSKHLNWELDWGSLDTSDETSECAWRVHEVNGGRNDREWTLIATGGTPEEAIRAALSQEVGR